MSIGEIILTENTNEISKVDALEIGYDDANRIVIEFDIDTLLDRYGKRSIVEHYVSKGVLHMITV